MSVCSLQLAAAHSLIMAAYKEKKVFELLSKASFELALHNNRFFFSSYNSMWIAKVLQRVENIIIQLVDKIPNINLLPTALKARVAVIAFELGCQCIHFFKDITKNMSPQCRVDILLCARNIFITQNFDVDRKKTILTLLEKSKMSVKFKPEFLMSECIEKPEIEMVAGRVLNVEARKRRTRRNDKAYKDTKKQINESLKQYNSTIKMFMEKGLTNQKRHCSWLTMSTYLVSGSDLESLMKYYFDTLELEEKRLSALEAMHYMLDDVTDINCDVLMYLGGFVDECDWWAIVEQHSVRLIEAFVPSWRYRYLCVEWFKMAVGKYDLETYRDFITYHLPVNKSWGDYETFELKQILRNIWLATPKDFKEDLTVQGAIEQFVISMWGDSDLFIFMIRDFDREKQKDMLASAALLAIGTHRQIVPVLMNRIKELGFVFTRNEEVVSLSTFLVYICRKNIICPQIGTYQNLFDEIGKFYFSHSNGADMFKELFLFAHTEILELLLLCRWSSDLMVELLNWFHNGSTVRVKRFIAEMLATGVIQRVYEKIIIDTGKTKTADAGLKLLKIQESKRISIKKAALLKPQVRTAIMIRQFKRKEFTIHSFECEWKVLLEDCKKNYVEREDSFESINLSADNTSKSLSSNHDTDESSETYECMYGMFDRYYHEEWRQKFFEELLVSDECLQALIHLIVHVERETSIKKYKYRFEMYDSIHRLFQTYRVCRKLDKLLEKHGHPNHSDTLYYGKQEATGDQLPQVRKVVDFSYRFLRTTLRRYRFWRDDSSDEEERENRNINMDLTELSIQEADAVNLKIPVVI